MESFDIIGEISEIDVMMQDQLTNAQFALCVDNSEYPASLELLKLYRVLPDDDAASDNDLRVIDESGEDYLYPASYFVVLSLPDDTARIVSESFARHFQPQPEMA
jgi:hypothetical protein